MRRGGRMRFEDLVLLVASVLFILVSASGFIFYGFSWLLMFLVWGSIGFLLLFFSINIVGVDKDE